MSASTYTPTEERELKDFACRSRCRNDEQDPFELRSDIFRAKQAQYRRDSRALLLAMACAIPCLIVAVVSGTLYLVKLGTAPTVCEITATTWTTRWTTSLSTTTMISTQSFTETIITTSTSISTPTLSITDTPTTTKPSSEARYCVPSAEYGGMDLHQLNSAYDSDIAWQIRYAVWNGLDIGGEDYLMVALRSVFKCVGTKSPSLVYACRNRYIRTAHGEMVCDSAAHATGSRSSTPTSWTTTTKTVALPSPTLMKS